MPTIRGGGGRIEHAEAHSIPASLRIIGNAHSGEQGVFNLLAADDLADGLHGALAAGGTPAGRRPHPSLKLRRAGQTFRMRSRQRGRMSRAVCLGGGGMRRIWEGEFEIGDLRLGEDGSGGRIMRSGMGDVWPRVLLE